MTDLDLIIREPRVLMILSAAHAVDFNFLLSASGLGRSDLFSHMGQLSRVGYVESVMSQDPKVPHTEYRLTGSGQKAARDCLFWLNAIRSARHCRQLSGSFATHRGQPARMAFFAHCGNQENTQR